MPTRHPYQRDRDLADIARMYLIEHKTQAQIAHIISVDGDRPYTITQQTVSADLRSLRKKWLKSALVDFNAARSKELARVDWMECEYQEAWEASKATMTMRGGVDDDNPTVTQKMGPGNPAFMGGIERCIKLRIDLLGLNAPKLLAVVDEDFDQAAWAEGREARHAKALEALAESEDDGEAE